MIRMRVAQVNGKNPKLAPAPDYAPAPEYAPVPTLVNDPNPHGRLSDKEVKQLLTEDFPVESPGTNLQVVWEYAHPDNIGRMLLVDVRDSHLYAVSVGPDQEILVYPVKLNPQPDTSNVKVFPPTEKGLDWESVSSTYFPNGFVEYSPTEKASVEASYAHGCLVRFSTNFYKSILDKLFEGYSHRKICNNPYKKNKY